MISGYLGSFSKTTFACGHGHTWVAQARKVIGDGTGCPHCFFDAKRSSKQQVNEKLAAKSIQMIGEYSSARIKTEFMCSHGHIWKSIPDNVIRGSGCPECSTSGFDNSKPSVLYVLNFGYFLKFGITNDLTRRLYEHKKNGKFTLVSEKLYIDGHHAQQLEKDIKHQFGGCFVSKKECPDGYTETLCVSKLDELSMFIQRKTDHQMLN